MKERFKRYLEREFRAIAPTEAAMDYRKQMLKALLDRAQELRIKGIQDEELIYDMCIDELGDFRQTLLDFEAKEIKTHQTKRKISFGATLAVATMLALTATYLIVGLAAGIWHPTWLIMVGGIFAGIVIASGFVIAKLVSKKKKVSLVRLFVMIDEVLFTVFLFLVLQLVFNINGSWQAFIVMPILLLGVDTALAFGLNDKLKLVELPIFVEVFCVLLYVLLGLNVGIWHPGWILCLGGVLFAAIELAVVVFNKNKKGEAKEKKQINDKYKKTDEQFYTEWDD